MPLKYASQSVDPFFPFANGSFSFCQRAILAHTDHVAIDSVDSKLVDSTRTIAPEELEEILGEDIEEDQAQKNHATNWWFLK